MTHYGIPEDKISVIPSAADLPDEPRRDSLQWERTGDCCRLLFVGVDWEEKGGRIAFNTMRCLHRMGIDASLTVVGCTPPPGCRHERLLVIPFLDKSSERDRRRFDQLYRDSHFFIIPSRAEALGIALCEASAFGLPILTAETGGTGQIVEDGVNGLRLPLHDEGEGYARFIQKTWSDADAYAIMRRNSRNKYERDLNWEVWGERVQRVIDALEPSLRS